MNIYIQQHNDKFQERISHFKEELAQIRTGQANAELVDGIKVEAYGTLTPIKQLATISIPEPKLIVIQPWDKSVLKEIEKAIVHANIGLNSSSDGEVVRVPMPPMTEENRKELVKIVGKRTEQSKIALRQLRDEVKEAIQKAETDKDISEDEKFKFLKELDEYTSSKSKELVDLADKKEEQIMKI